MIPKIIYYAWFGKGKKSELEEKCIATWKQLCPDYQIVEINEDNFNIENWNYLDSHKKEYIKEAYEKTNWSFVSDIARMEWLRFHAGFMLDTDIELLKPLEEIRKNNDTAFISECHRGFYMNPIIGVSSGLPTVIQKAYEKLIRGKAIHILINEEAYKSFNLLGQTYIHKNNCSIYGIGYIGNEYDIITPQTVAIHHDENTWTKKDTMGFKILSDIVPCKIFINDKRDRENEAELYGFPQDDAKLFILANKKADLSMVFSANYFLNERVVEFIGKDYKIQRNYIVSEFEEITLNNGNRLRYDSGN